MGCFNVAATMSRRTINSGERVAMFLLTPQTKHIPGGTNWVSDGGSTILFRPVALPIFGQYDDYGKIENVIEDANVRILQDLWGNSIEEIVEDIQSCDGQGLTDNPCTAVMWEKASIYENIVEWAKTTHSALGSYQANTEALQAFGFVEDNETTRPPGIEGMWKWPNSEFSLGVDQYGRVDGKRVMSTMYRAHDIITVCKTEGIDLTKTDFYHELTTKTSYLMQIEEAIRAKIAWEGRDDSLKSLSGMIKALDDEEESGTVDEKLEKLRQLLGNESLISFGGAAWANKVQALRNYRELEYAVCGVLAPAFSDFLLFDATMYQMNCSYSPGSGGEQHGSVEVEQVVNKIIGADIEARLRVEASW